MNNGTRVALALAEIRKGRQELEKAKPDPEAIAEGARSLLERVEQLLRERRR